MSIVFTKSANGEATCSYNSIRLHSAYNPSHEAERFVQNLKCDFNPKFILITGAALSYCAIYLKKMFPCANICTVQFTRDFKIADKLWDKSFYLENTDIPLSEQLFNYMGEEGVISCFFTSWQPSEKAFPTEHEQSWQQIKKAVIKSRNILATRSFFAKRWVKNSMRFCLFSQKTCSYKKGSSPILICASGPSLQSSIPYIKKFRNNFFLIAVSSAMYPLTTNEIIPDLCISTDGGYWAKHHISHALVNTSIPMALSAESACNIQILQGHEILPLDYGDGISHTLLRALNFSTFNAYRNGTVSGTAAQLALSLTNNNVFFCGLDLSPSSAYAHTQPNELEIFNMKDDNRIKNLETRTFPSCLNNPSLNIYKAWFCSSNFNGRLYRLSNDFKYRNTLGTVKDVNWDFFEQNINDTDNIKPIKHTTHNNLSKKEKFKKIKDAIDSNINDKDWIKEAVPADYIVYERCLGMDAESNALKKIQGDMQIFYKDIMRAFSREELI